LSPVPRSDGVTMVFFAGGTSIEFFPSSTTVRPFTDFRILMIFFLGAKSLRSYLSFPLFLHTSRTILFLPFAINQRHYSHYLPLFPFLQWRASSFSFQNRFSSPRRISPSPFSPFFPFSDKRTPLPRKFETNPTSLSAGLPFFQLLASLVLLPSSEFFFFFLVQSTKPSERDSFPPLRSYCPVPLFFSKHCLPAVPPISSRFPREQFIPLWLFFRWFPQIPCFLARPSSPLAAGPTQLFFRLRLL